MTIAIVDMAVPANKSDSVNSSQVVSECFASEPELNVTIGEAVKEEKVGTNNIMADSFDL